MHCHLFNLCLCVRELANYMLDQSLNHSPIDCSTDEVLWKMSRLFYQNLGLDIQILLVSEQEYCLRLTINSCLLALRTNNSSTNVSPVD